MRDLRVLLPLFHEEWEKLEEAGALDSIGGKQYRRLLRAWLVDECPVPIDKWLGLMIALNETMVEELSKLYKDNPKLVKTWELKEPGTK